MKYMEIQGNGTDTYKEKIDKSKPFLKFIKTERSAIEYSMSKTKSNQNFDSHYNKMIIADK